MIVKLLTEHHLELLSLLGGCRCPPESTLVEMSNCWKSHAAAHMLNIESNIHAHILLNLLKSLRKSDKMLTAILFFPQLIY